MIMDSSDLEAVQTVLLAMIASWCMFDIVRYMILRKFK